MGKRNDARKITINERRDKAIQLRKGGASLRAIAATLDCDVATIHGDLKAMFAEAIRENVDNADQLRALELERLDDLLMKIRAQINLGDLKAIDRAIRISEQRAKLLGLYMPVKQEIAHSGGMFIKAYKEFTPDAWDDDDRASDT